MSLQLLIAEKPSMGRAIAAALGISGPGDGFIQGKNAIVSWCIGHLGELAMPDAYDPALKRWTWDSLPFMPDGDFKIQVTSADTKAQFIRLRKLMNDPRITEIVNACDSGREGEYIFDLVYRLAGCKKPVKRLWTSSLTDDAIRQAYQSMKPGDHYAGLRDAGRARSEGDWLVGVNGTRAQTLHMRMGGIPLEHVANVGRVVTPVLYLIWLRDETIRTFVPEDFWNVIGDFETEAGRYSGKWFRRVKEGTATKDIDRFKTEAEANALIDQIKDKPARVAGVLQKDERKAPEQLYDLTTLQRECNKRFGMTAEHTLERAQELYESKVLTYPRTNSRHLTPDVEATLPAIFEKLAQQDLYAPFLDEMKREGYFPRALGKRFVDAAKVEDHHAIIPTGDTPRGLNSQQQQVYDLVVRRTLAAFYPDRIDAKTVLLTQIETEFFKTTGSVCRQEGWSAIDPPSKGSKKQGEDEEVGSLPNVKKGDAATAERIYHKKGRTTPPKPYNEADLLGAMETAGRMIDDEELKSAMKDTGLGTPATRAATIEKLIANKHVKRERKTLRCTDQGCQLIESIESDIIKSPELTGQWESKLAQMARGQYDRESFMRKVRELTQELIDNIRERSGTREQREVMDRPRAEAKKLDTPCPKCRGALYLKEWQGRYYADCENRRKGKKNACSIVFDTDEAGIPAAGTCRFEGCNGPVRRTRKGSRICLLCEKWQDDRPAGTATAVTCERCKEAEFYEIVAKSTKLHYYKCPTCEFFRPKNAEVIAGGCKATGCGGDLLEQDGKNGGRWRKCMNQDCHYTEDVPRSGGTKAGGAGKPEADRWTFEMLDKTCPTCRTHKLKVATPPANKPGRGPFICCQDRKCKYISDLDQAAA